MTFRKPATVEDLDSEMDAYMLKTKGGLDAQMDEYMSKTKVHNRPLSRQGFTHIFRKVSTPRWTNT